MAHTETAGPAKGTFTPFLRSSQSASPLQTVRNEHLRRTLTIVHVETPSGWLETVAPLVSFSNSARVLAPLTGLITNDWR